MPQPTISLERLRELAATLKARDAQKLIPEVVLEESTEIIQPHDPSILNFTTVDKYGKVIELNSKQREFVTLAASGKSCVLIGPAGTGKTTSQFAAVSNLIQSGKAGILSAGGHKHLRSDTPGIVVCAFTRRAVANIRRNMPADMRDNCITSHKLLEYEPVYYDYQDEEGNTKTKMVFQPARSADNPLPSSIHTIIFEESSMLGTDLYLEVINACPHKPQVIFLGDIQQLPPVFGPAILGFKLLELPVVELTEVYRQALESPIISLAHRILSAQPLPASQYKEWSKNGLIIHPWKKKIEDIVALNTLGQFFIAAESKKEYDPEEDMILIPFNKACGTDELNKIIANHLAKKNGSEVHQIIAGFNRLYFRVGEKVLYDKEDAIITKIEKNPSYSGAPFLAPSVNLNYWGHYDGTPGELEKEDGDDSVDFLLQAVANSNGEDRVKKCSHIITLRMRDSETERTVSTAGDANSLLFAYALTVHKAQGSEWRKVFFIVHQSHATMIQRELLYTAVTRAKEELYIICEPETFTKGIMSQRVKGNTLAEKAEFFKGKLDNGFTLNEG